MAVNILTFEDLQKFKMELLAELKGLINNSTPSTQKKWLKSYEVRQMLGISRGTLQNLNTNGSLPATRIGGLLFFIYDDIQKLMQGKKMIKR
jgi:predicted DNA-binding transcriptional regulator AlpA